MAKATDEGFRAAEPASTTANASRAFTRIVNDVAAVLT